MSHSRKDKSIPEEVILLQQDLKDGYTRRQLLTLAHHHGIPEHLNTERLTMEIAKANFKAMHKQSANFPWGTSSAAPAPTELATLTPTATNKAINRQTLAEASNNCGEQMDSLYQDLNTRLGDIYSRREALFNALEEGLKAAPEAFDQIAPQILGDCNQELAEIHTCLAQTADRASKTTEQKLHDVQEFMKKLHTEGAAHIPDSLTPGPIQALKAASAPVAPVEGLGEVTPPKAVSAPGIIPGLVPPSPPPPKDAPPTPPPSKDAPSTPPPPSKDPEEFVFDMSVLPSVPLATGDTPDIKPPPPPMQSISEILAECKNDKDCEEMREAGLLSGRLPGQKVICVSKRSGSPDCAYQA